MNDDKLNKMDVARHLLPEPGPEVVGELIAELRKAQDHLKIAWGVIAMLSANATKKGGNMDCKIDNCDLYAETKRVGGCLQFDECTFAKRIQRLHELLAKCNGVLVAHGYDENEGIRKEVEDELGYT